MVGRCNGCANCDNQGLAVNESKQTNPVGDAVLISGRREFIQHSIGALSALMLPAVTFAQSPTGDKASPALARPSPAPYPIEPEVKTTVDRMISFPGELRGLAANQLDDVAKYDAFGYGAWAFGPGLPVVQRTDVMPAGYRNPQPATIAKLAHFFTISDIHITDKEAPNQLIAFQGMERFAYSNTSIYSPVMLYTTHVLDAAIQTINALHKSNPVDFGLSLGDTCNSTQYNELRWYLDVIDGKVITPSSGAHLGADTIDYQKPYQAAGLDKSIPWYPVMGNHDHFYIGSFPVDADKSLGIRESYVSSQVWSVADALVPHFSAFPVLFDMRELKSSPQYFTGLIDGATPYGDIVYAGLSTSPTFAKGPPTVAADANRRSLRRSEWVQEFFTTTSGPVGHGFNLVDKAGPYANIPGFTCYSFVPKAGVPLKVIVLDDTQSEDDGSNDIHGHGYLDAARWAWLQAELAAGQAANQLMIIAAHVPIGVAAIGSEMEWWLNEDKTPPEHRNAVDLKGLVSTLQDTPNLLAWIAGHRHLNTVKAFVSPDATKPERGFWQVETASLRDFPQQFRTFEIHLNSDYTVSSVTTNVDPAVAAGTPAAQSRKYAVAVQQIVNRDVCQSTPNVRTVGSGVHQMPVPSMDPSRPQDGAGDPSIRFTDLTGRGVPCQGSCNAELLKQLSPEMVAALRKRFS